MKSVGIWGKLLSTSVFFYPRVYQIIFFPRICSGPKYPLIYLSWVVKLLKRHITFIICLLEYCHKEHLLALIICSLNRLSFLPQCDRPFMPDCGKILFLKLEKSECKALFINALLYFRYSIPGLAFQFLSHFILLDMILETSLVIFLCYILILFLFYLLTPSLKQLYFKRTLWTLNFLLCCTVCP